VLVVNYWAAWAPPARAQLETLNRLAAEFGAEGVEFVAVAMDSGGWPAVDTFERSLPIGFLVLLDQGNRAAAILGLQAIPTTLLVDSQGQIVRRWVGLVDADTLRRELRRLLQT